MLRRGSGFMNPSSIKKWLLELTDYSIFRGQHDWDFKRKVSICMALYYKN